MKSVIFNLLEGFIVDGWGDANSAELPEFFPLIYDLRFETHVRGHRD